MPMQIQRRFYSLAIACVGAAGLCVVMGCNDLTNQQLPAGTQDPAAYNTPAGARAAYQAAIAAFQPATMLTPPTSTSPGGTPAASPGGFLSTVIYSGLLADELQANNLGSPTTTYQGPGATLGSIAIDDRQLSEGQSVSADPYTQLQAVRAMTSQAIGMLTKYSDAAPRALRGQLYAYQGYAEILLADVFCSGIPLSTLDFEGDYTYAPGSTTADVYQHAIARFDSALAYAGDSARFLNLARVGKARALLALGRYSDAAQAVVDVPTDYQYTFPVDWRVADPLQFPNANGSYVNAYGSVSDSEGINGLPYRTNGQSDPRTATVQNGTNTAGRPLYTPIQYGGATPGVGSITVASGIEARLIEAEAQLQPASAPSGPWLATLNALRATAITPALLTLADPGTDSGRVSLLFRERAYWLFLTAHRQGDLRRLVRQYHRPVDRVYPTGSYPSAIPFYGADVTVPIPDAEHRNPLFAGCLSRGA